MKYLSEVNRHLVPRGFQPGGISDAVAESEARYDRVLKYLRYR
jgi:hypothetical protein